MQLTQNQIDTLRNKGLTDDKIKAMALHGGYSMPEQSTIGAIGSSLIKSEKGFGQSIAGAVGSTVLGGTKVAIDEANQRAEQVQTNLLTRIKEKRAKGEDTSRLIGALKTLDSEVNFYDILNTSTGGSLDKSAKQVFGEGFGVATDIIGAGALPGGIGQATKAKGFIQGVKTGAKAGIVGGGIFGTAKGATGAMQENKTAGEVVGAGLRGGIEGGVAGGVIGGVLGGVSGKLNARKEIKLQKEQLLQSRPDSKVAKYTLDGQGKLANDIYAQEAIKQGLDEGTVATIKGASAQDKIKASKALDILVKGRSDPRYKALNRPSDVIGESVMERYKVVQSANTTAAKQLDTVAKGLQGTKVDPTPAVKAFIEDLDDLGVSISNGKINYKGSDLEGLEAPQKVLNNLVKRMTEVSDDGYQLHRLKRFIDENVQYGKMGEGLSGRTESIIKGFRRNLDALLDNSSSAYNTTNSIYANTRNAIDDFVTSAGAKFNPNSPNSIAKIGTLARRILSNAQSRTDVLNSLQKLQDVAEQYGGKFTDDVITQTVFVNDLERLFGTQAPTSLAGEVSKGVQRAGTIAGKLKSSTGIIDLALQATGEGIEKLRGINEENLIKAIKLLLAK